MTTGRVIVVTELSVTVTADDNWPRHRRHGTVSDCDWPMTTSCVIIVTELSVTVTADDNWPRH